MSDEAHEKMSDAISENLSISDILSKLNLLSNFWYLCFRSVKK